MCKLLGFDFEIHYKAGHLNQAVDALSRRPTGAKCASLVSPQWREWDKIKNKLLIDEFLKRILNDLSQGSVVHDGFEWWDGLLFYKG